MSVGRFFVALFVVLGIWLAPSSARAETLEWKKEWPTFRPSEVALTGAFAAQSANAAFVMGQPKRNWEGGMLFDDGVRNALRLHNRGARTAVATTSDMMYYALLAYPLIDAPLVGGVRGNGKVATQTLAINLESYALAGAIAMTGEKIGRARPMALECDVNADYDRRCGEEGRNNASFVSGHTALAFTGAGLTCAHHLNMPLYGGGAADTTACIAAMTVASASGVMRILSDNHYTTDVLLGAGVGLASGYFFPKLLHYSRGGDTRMGTILPTYESRAVSMVVAPTVSPQMAGLTINGSL